MPFTPTDAPHSTKKASTDKLKKLWARVANRALQLGDSDAVAIKKANAAVAGAS